MLVKNLTKLPNKSKELVTSSFASNDKTALLSVGSGKESWMLG